MAKPKRLTSPIRSIEQVAAANPAGDRVGAGAKQPRPRDQFMVTGRPPGDPLTLISMDETSRRVMFCKVHIYRLISEGKFPKQVKVGRARVAFVEAEVDDWLRARIAQRDGQAA
jgi:prophage regulatory protein